MNAPVLEILHYTKSYDGKRNAVNDLTLTVREGDICGFIGQNGAGKTTTLRACAGVLDFKEGDIRIGGRSVRKEPIPCKQMTAYIPDNPDLYDFLTGVQYLNFVADIYGVEKQARADRIARYAGMFRIEEDLASLIGAYSHGMKQKLALTAALLHEPKLLLLDEPFVGLDPEAAFRVKEVFRELCSRGAAIFFSTHVLDVAEKLCNRIAIIKNGTLVAEGNTDEVRGDESLEQVFLEVLGSEG